MESRIAERRIIWTLFILLSVITAASAAPELTVEPAEIDLGIVDRGTVAKTTIKLSNTGDAPLELQKLQVSCPCTTAELPPPGERIIAPGASVSLPVSYDTKDMYGDVGSTIVLHTNDPKLPIAIIDLGLRVESLVIFTPETGVAWTLAPRGGVITTPLTIMAGNESNDIELIELTMAKPGITPHTELKTVNGRKRVKVEFSIEPDVPMGVLTNEVHARVRVGGEEATIHVPLRGGVIGDVLITPPAIISPRTAYQQGARISEITVRSSDPDRPAPKLIGVQVLGPLQTEVKPVGSETGDQVITVAAAADAPGGPQSGTVYVMTSSEDDPIVAVPVYFRMAEAVRAKPDHAVLYLDDPAQAQKRIELEPGSESAFTITGLRFDSSLVKAVAVPEQESDSRNAAVDISIANNASARPQSTMVVIETDRPGAESLSIPVLIRTRTETTTRTE